MGSIIQLLSAGRLDETFGRNSKKYSRSCPQLTLEGSGSVNNLANFCEIIIDYK